MSDLPATADVVVIGGGVMGTSTLHHLARLGITDTVLIEAETLGAGSTSKNAGGFRAQFTDPHNITIAMENIRRLERFEAEVGGDIDFRQWGYLLLLTEDDLPSFEDAVALQRSLGVPSEILSRDQAEGMVPGLNFDGIVGASWCPIDGYCTPEAVGLGYARAATKQGARIIQGVPVSEIRVDAGAVRGVETPRGSIDAPVVVIAAGAWSGIVAATAGVEIPIERERRFIWTTAPGDDLPHRLPLTIDFATGFYLHREGHGLLLGGKEQSMDELAPVAVSRYPGLMNLEITHTWWGYYAMSPDHNAIVGMASDPAGLVYMTGFSGHGFQQAPVMGEYVAELIAGVEPTFDLAGLSLERFADGGPVPEFAII